jgi:S1-C subfamily serine protease
VSRSLRLVCAYLVALLLLPAAGVAKEHRDSATRARHSVVTILAGEKQGTGFAFQRPGELLTNAHVVKGYRHVDVVLADGSRVRGDVAALDTVHDLATVKAPIDLRPLLPARRRPAVGSRVVAIGSPLGLSGSVSEGIVSAVRRRPGQGLSIQTDVAVNPGNSGGPLLDTRGRVLGVTTSRAAAGISFAVPIAYASQLPQHPVSSSSDNGGLSLLWISAAALLFLVLAAIAVVLLMRRRRRPAAPVEVRIRPGASVSPPIRHEPEPRVELKPRPE